MLLCRHEFYFVLERDQLCRRLHAPPKPYLYQALEFRNGSDLPEEAKVGMTMVTLAGYCVCSTTVPCSTRFFFFAPSEPIIVIG